MLDAADLPRFPLGQLARGVPFTMLGGRPRVFLDTMFFACAIEPAMSDAELRDYEGHRDETLIGGA
jgi:hypothetical protein